MGIQTIGQLRQWPVESLKALLGASGEQLHALANGNDDSEVTPDSEEKSLSHETTFAVDVLSTGELETTLRWLSDKVATRLRQRGIAGRTIFLKIRYSDFTTATRRKTLSSPTNLSDAIHAAACELLRERTHAGKRPVRLLGLGLSSFGVERELQGELFPTEKPGAAKMDRLERAADAIRAKLGKNALSRASFSAWKEVAEDE